ncbi:hypothetical protein P692DRAFT_20823607 [Suillus brevipes Sb2]|nr:hypothetical protein P692DRAFT_20823607 [Suillus brevipes Sb2]
MGSDVFSASSSMGTMPKKIITQAEYFWSKYNTPNLNAGNTEATNHTTTNFNTAAGGRSFLSRTTQGIGAFVRDSIWSVLCAVARLVATFRRVIVHQKVTDCPKVHRLKNSEAWVKSIRGRVKGDSESTVLVAEPARTQNVAGDRTI